VYPVVLGPGESVTRVFHAAMAQPQHNAAANGGSLNVHRSSAAGGLPQAALQGRGGGLQVSGHAGVSILADQTANGSRLAVVSAFWAPAASLHTDRAALASVGACFRPGHGTPFLVVRDPFVTYSITPGLRVASESQDGIDIFAPSNKAGANYFNAGVPPKLGGSFRGGAALALLPHDRRDHHQDAPHRPVPHRRRPERHPRALR